MEAVFYESEIIGYIEKQNGYYVAFIPSDKDEEKEAVFKNRKNAELWIIKNK